MTDRVRVMAACGLLMILSGLSYGGALEQQVSQQVVRLHIVANSDSPEDQRLKLQVRDAVLEQCGEWFTGGTAQQVRENLAGRLEELERVCEEEAALQGRPCEATATLTTMYFSTRDYGAFSLPAGQYEALRVELGEGQGHNWWCVMYPPLCVGTATGLPDPEEVCRQYQLEDGTIDLITSPQGDGKAQVKFKLAEWYGQGRQWLAQCLGRSQK
ncbi:MAG: stage II sporulation protein R [Eubacteriales bacterium]|jgi:stage II sporulation protein R